MQSIYDAIFGKVKNFHEAIAALIIFCIFGPILTILGLFQIAAPVSEGSGSIQFQKDKD
jgi:hypothetical protein